MSSNLVNLNSKMRTPNHCAMRSHPERKLNCDISWSSATYTEVLLSLFSDSLHPNELIQKRPPDVFELNDKQLAAFKTFVDVVCFAPVLALSKKNFHSPLTTMHQNTDWGALCSKQTKMVIVNQSNIGPGISNQWIRTIPPPILNVLVISSPSLPSLYTSNLKMFLVYTD